MNQNCLEAGMSLINILHELKAKELDMRKNIVFSICHVESGKAGLDCKPESCILRGTIRSFDAKTKDFLVARIKEVAVCTAQTFGCEIDCDIWDKYPAIINHKA